VEEVAKQMENKEIRNRAKRRRENA